MSGSASAGQSQVASLAEAWIEMIILEIYVLIKFVASLAEAWIEISLKPSLVRFLSSPPSRRRGLKFIPVLTSAILTGRLPRGGVD